MQLLAAGRQRRELGGREDDRRHLEAGLGGVRLLQDPAHLRRGPGGMRQADVAGVDVGLDPGAAGSLGGGLDGVLGELAPRAEVDRAQEGDVGRHVRRLCTGRPCDVRDAPPMAAPR